MATVNRDSIIYSVFGNKAVVIADISFGTYSAGGDDFNIDQLFGLHSVDYSSIGEANGYRLAYDNNKIKAYRNAPPIVYEEKHTPTGTDAVQTVTTNYPPAFFINAARIGGNKKFRSTAVTPGDDEIALNAQMAANERATLSVKDYDRLEGEGAFTGAATNWTLASGWTYSSNTVLKNGDGTGTLAHDNFAAVSGRTYLLTYTISSWTVGTCTPTLGGEAGTAVGANGTYTEVFTASTTDGVLFTPTNTARFTIDSVTIYDLTEPVYLTYVTQAWKDVWDNVVQDEDVTLSSSAATSLTYSASALMYADRTSTTAKALTLIDEDDTAASGEVAVYLNQAEDNIKASHSDENGKTARFTYLKTPSSGFLTDRAFDNESATKAGSDPYTNTFDYPILLWGYTGQVPVNGGTTQRLIPYAGTPTAGDAVIDWFTPGIRGAAAPASGTVIGTKSDVTATGAGIWGTIQELQTQALEAPDGEDLSGLGYVTVIMYGT